MSRRNGFASGQVLGARERQEDSVGAAQLRTHGNAITLVLADGMGGHAGGDVAASVATRAVLANLKAGVAPPWAKLKPALKAANDAIRRAMDTNVSLRGMGCTLVAATITANRLRWISVGDSVLLLVRNGQLSRLNADHSMRPVFAEMVERGQLRQEEADRDPSRNALRSAVSGAEIEMIDAPDADLPLQDGDVVLLISDGVETLDDREIAALTTRAMNSGPKSVVDALLRAVEGRQTDHQDNASIVAYIHARRRGATAGKPIRRGSLLAIPTAGAALLAAWIAVIWVVPASWWSFNHHEYAGVTHSGTGDGPVKNKKQAPRPTKPTNADTGPVVIPPFTTPVTIRPAQELPDDLKPVGVSHGATPSADHSAPVAPAVIGPDTEHPAPGETSPPLRPTDDGAGTHTPTASATHPGKPKSPPKGEHHADHRS
jgi:serine/threonine protein phosphatase PrpC